LDFVSGAGVGTGAEAGAEVDFSFLSRLKIEKNLLDFGSAFRSVSWPCFSGSVATPDGGWLIWSSSIFSDSSGSVAGAGSCRN
jgi:hypothetical protein